MRVKFISFAILSVVFIVLTGCPYASEVPLSEANEKFSKEILGKWLAPSDAKKEAENIKLMPEYRKKLTPTYYIISAISKTALKIEKHEFQTSDSTYTVKLHNAHTSKVGDYTFINIKPEDESKYYLYRIEFFENKYMTLYPVTDYIKETFENSEDMNAYFNKYKELSFFYSQKEEYVKM